MVNETRRYHAGVEGMNNSPIPEVLGSPDAVDEWTSDKIEIAKSNFINIDSYNKFIDPSRIFLVGRIGSGKTTILNKFKHSIESGENHDYSSTIIIDSRDYIAQLGIAIRTQRNEDLLFSEIEYIARSEWEKMLNIVAMKELYDHFAASDPSDFIKIRHFLEEQGILMHNRSVVETLKLIIENLKSIDSTIVQGVSCTISSINQSLMPDYTSALDEFYRNLNRYGKLLILVDSIEKYEFNDPIVLAILNALVNLCLEYNRNNKLVTIKMAAPSELIPKLASINSEKISNKIVYIRWSQNDLKTFIAVRIYKYVNGIPSTKFVDREEAVRFFDEYYEESCKTRCDFMFKTFPYCMAYTQKEPRQILSIFNAWLFYEKTRRNENRMDLVNKAITYDELSRIKGALSIYSSIHPKMFEMFQRTFGNRKYCFSEEEFDEWLSTCTGIRGNVDAYDLKRYFISSGLVGTMVEMHNIEKGNPELKNNRDVRIKEVIFEYQYKEQLFFNNQTRFCLHPMVFSALNIEVDIDTFVYPKPFELENEFIPW